MHRKRELGLLSPEEDVILLQQEAEEHRRQEEEPVSRTRRGKKKEIEQRDEVIEKPLPIEIPQRDYTNFNNGMYKCLSDVAALEQRSQIDELVNASVKTKLLFELMTRLKKEGHRVLIFSMSKRMLDLLETIIQGRDDYAQDFTYFRIDGDTEIASRESICKQFNADKNIFCGLLTTKVGGFGLTLTGADRAIILDPDWNPANDN